MTELTRIKAIKLIQRHSEYFDEVVEAAIIDLLEEDGITEGDREFIWELQYIYDSYVGKEKYGRQLT